MDKNGPAVERDDFGLAALHIEDADLKIDRLAERGCEHYRLKKPLDAQRRFHQALARELVTHFDRNGADLEDEFFGHVFI